jgi:Clr5 domain
LNSTEKLLPPQNTMAGRPPKDISHYKDEISELFLQGSTILNIVSYLFDNYNIKIGHRTLERRLAEWGVRKKDRNIDTFQLRARISVLFFQCCLGDKGILTVLKGEGYSINARGLSRIRKDMGLVRKVSPVNREEAEKLLLETVRKELDKGFIEGLGRGNLYSYFRSSVMQIVSR